jgi:hypothetical protein
VARTRKRRTQRAKSLKQSVLIGIKVPASPTSDTKPARKLLDAIGRPRIKMTKKRTPRPPKQTRTKKRR